MRAVAFIYYKLLHITEIVGRENIPSATPFIICANHMHLLDPAVISLCTKEKIVFLAKKEIFSSRFSRWFFNKIGCIPVSRDGNDSYSLKKALQAIKDKKVLGIFPEGTREKEASRLEFKPGVSMLAIKTGTPLIPVFLHGSHRPFRRLKVIIGPPIDLSAYSGHKLTGEDFKYIANHIIAEKIFGLKDEI